MHVSVSWGSHLPVLMRLMAHTTGAVLELGAGLFSSPYLHYACREAHRPLVTYDNDVKYTRYICTCTTRCAACRKRPTWDAADLTGPWDIALVDHQPAERRVIDVRRLRDCTRFIVLHDTDPLTDDAFGYPALWPLFPYRYDCHTCHPCTTVLSLTSPLDTLLAGL